MKGQWIGKATGANDGLIVVNIDEMPSHFQGMVYLNEANPLLPSIAAAFKTKNRSNSFELRTDFILPIHPHTGLPVYWDTIKQFYGEGIFVPKFADVKGNLDNDSLKLSWTTEDGRKGECLLPKSKADKPSELVPESIKEAITGWAKYKEYVAGLEGRRLLFRGQNEPWRLRTSFHRAGRADLTRFLNEDIQALHRHLSAKTKHLFNLDNPKENGAFFSLVQHHGYPTPLLDWTFSPYVAAFFAYRGISSKMARVSNQTKKVRILVFNQEKWKNDWIQLKMLTPASLHLSIEEFLAVENERVIPQQAASTVTNIDDVESYIKARESDDKKYLWAIDLPVRDRDQVVRELSYMGITAGSLFPGLDGACEELKERNFDI
jgi:hypothetical protein